MIRILDIFPADTLIDLNREHLASLGIVVGPWSTEGFKRCEVSEEAMQKLESLWMNRYIWSESNQL